jgi:hypothetical protein
MVSRRRHTVKLRFLLITACVVVLGLPALSSAQHVHVGVGVGGPHGGVAVATGPHHAVVVGGYYRYPYYYGSAFYGPWWYGAPYWYGAYWYGAPYWYGPYAYAGYPAPYYGGGSSLRLEVSPRNAEVFIDGHFAGIVDNFDGFFQHLDLPPGQHDLEIYLAGHRSVKQQVYLQPGKTFRVKYTMETLQPGDEPPVRPTANDAPPQDQPGPPQRSPQRPPTGDEGVAAEQPRANGYGTVAVRVQPGDAEVLIDGEKWNGNADGDRLEVQLSAGVHNVEVRKSGFRTYSTDVTVRNGQTATLNVALTRQ